MKIDRRSLTAGMLFAAGAGPATARASDGELAAAGDIDAAVARALAKLDGAPGLGVAVYTPQGTYARGFGLADVEAGKRADADTAYYIASSTKSFTALAMAALHRRGLIDLEGPVSGVAPGAPFPADAGADRARVRDLLTHTSGLSNDPIGFRVAYTGQHDAATLWRLLGETRPNPEAPLGKHQYTNEGYNILTVLTDRSLGVRWQDLLEREIFRPAGMTRTTAYMSRARAAGRTVAQGYVSGLPEGRARVELMKVDATMQSAGGLVTSPNDAVRWLELMANDGKVGGRQVVDAQAVRLTRAGAVDTGQVRADDFGANRYSLGWNIGRYGEDDVFFHYGGFAGFRAHISYIPARRIGVAVFANDSAVGGRLGDAVAKYAYGRLSGDAAAQTTFDAVVEGLAGSLQQGRDAVKADREKRAQRPWTLSRPRAAYAGTYVSAAMGEVVVRAEGDDLLVSFGQMRSRAEPFTQPETIRVELVPFSGSVIGFEPGDGPPGALNYMGARFGRAG